MYGTFYITFIGVVSIVLFVVALLFAASPLLAVIIAGIAGIALFVVMSLMRQRSREQEDRPEGAPEGRPATPAGKVTGPSGKRPSGEPASGEG